ncbi:hypothetical protein JW948_16280 [bacterium]|nr:hypothetical protein [bacterium]
MKIKVLCEQNLKKRRPIFGTGRFRFTWILTAVLVGMPVRNRAIQLFSPTGVGLDAVMTRQNANDGGTPGLGAGLMFLINYTEPTTMFLNVKSGFYTVNDGNLKMDHFQTIIFPSVEMQLGKLLSRNPQWNPAVYFGLNFFAAFDKEKLDNKVSTSERFFQTSLLLGGGLVYQPSYLYSIHINADYRHVIFASEHVGRQYYMFQFGFLFHQ